MPRKKAGALVPNEVPQVERRRGRQPAYRPEYCDYLVRHMGDNEQQIAYSFESFGAVVGCTAGCLHRWRRQYPDFEDAYRRGQMAAEKAITYNLYKMARGEYTLTYERTFWDGKAGQFIKETVTEPAKSNAQALIFLAKNICGWKDKREVNVTADEGGQLSVRVETYEAKIERINNLRKARQEIEAHKNVKVIDHHPEADNERTGTTHES